MTAMKHAFLILAHNNFASLRRLVSELDFPDNDIFIHLDRKAAYVPEITVRYSMLTWTSERIDVRWGDLSVVMAEYVLFETAFNGNGGPYSRYHLLSGVDVCLKSQQQLHLFFDRYPDKEFIGYTLLSPTPELVRKFNRWHLFPHSFQSSTLAVRAVRHIFIRLQELSGLKRNRHIDIKKGSQWVSVTPAMVQLFLSGKDWVKKTFTHSFCPDEAVFQTLCWDSQLRQNIFSLEDDSHGCMRAISWQDGEMKSWSETDIERLKDSEFMFARKHLTLPSVSILVPAFNAESTISRTLDSILAQNYPNLQLCIADDCSSDRTASIIEEYIPKFEAKAYRIRTMRHESNAGAATARNTLLGMAASDYIIFADSDDVLPAGAVSRAVSKAQDTACDIVGWDWTLSQPGVTRYMKQASCHTPNDAIVNLMAGTMRWNLWLFMFRRSLFDGFSFTPGMDMGEDMMCVLTMMNRASSFTQIHSALYTYVQTDSSISKSMTAANRDQVSRNVIQVEELFREDNRHGISPRFLEYLKLNIKLPLLVSENNDDYLCWSKWYSGSNRYIPLNVRIPFRTRLLQMLAWFRMWNLVRLYNRLVYGRIYDRMFKKDKTEKL